MKLPSNLDCDGKNVIEMGPWVTIAGENGLALSRWQAITSTNVARCQFDPEEQTPMYFESIH